MLFSQFWLCQVFSDSCVLPSPINAVCWSPDLCLFCLLDLFADSLLKLLYMYMHPLRLLLTDMYILDKYNVCLCKYSTKWKYEIKNKATRLILLPQIYSHRIKRTIVSVRIFAKHLPATALFRRLTAHSLLFRFNLTLLKKDPENCNNDKWWNNCRLSATHGERRNHKIPAVE